MFEEASDDLLNRLSKIAQVVDYSPGESFIHEGADEDDMFVIVEGTAEVRANGELIAQVSRNDIVGEMQVLDPSPRSATVAAVTPVTLLCIGKIPFDVLASDSPEVFRGVATILIRRLRMVATKMDPIDLI